VVLISNEEEKLHEVSKDIGKINSPINNFTVFNMLYFQRVPLTLRPRSYLQILAKGKRNTKKYLYLSKTLTLAF